MRLFINPSLLMPAITWFISYEYKYEDPLRSKLDLITWCAHLTTFCALTSQDEFILPFSEALKICLPLYELILVDPIHPSLVQKFAPEISAAETLQLPKTATTFFHCPSCPSKNIVVLERRGLYRYFLWARLLYKASIGSVKPCLNTFLEDQSIQYIQDDAPVGKSDLRVCNSSGISCYK
jgi:hypothetical protein